MDFQTRLGLFQRGFYQRSGLYPGLGYITGLEFYSNEESPNPPTLERGWWPTAAAQSVTHQNNALAPLQPTVGLSLDSNFQNVPATQGLAAAPPSVSLSQPRLPVGLPPRPAFQRVPISQLIHGLWPLSATQAAPQQRPRVKFEPSVWSETEGSLDQRAAPSSAVSSPALEHKHLVKSTDKNLVKSEPAGADDQTTPHGDQTYWSLENLPDVLYVLRPRTNYRKSRHRVYTTTNAITGKQINDFAVLPSQISSNVEGWRLEAWMRLDRRITEQDIMDRVNPKYKLTADEIETRRENFRRNFHVANWNVQKSIWDIDRMLRASGIDTEKNSTRGLTPGLIDPSKGEAGGRIPIPRENVIPMMMMQASTNLKSASRNFGAVREPRRRPGPLHASQADSRREPNSREIEAEQIPQQDAAPDTNASATASPKFKTFDSTDADFEYPDIDALTHCIEPPTQAFHDEDDTVGRTMTLRKFLKKNKISYEDWLLRDYNVCDRDTQKRGRDEDLESQEPANISYITPTGPTSKRRSVDNPNIEASETSVAMNNNRKRRRAEEMNVDESAAGDVDSTKRRPIETSDTGKTAKRSSNDFWATLLKD